MGKFEYIVTFMLVLSLFAVTGVGSAAGESMTVVEKVISSPPLPAPDMQEMNFTKLEISPRYGNLRLQAGENKETTVTIKNKEKKAVSVKPNVIVPPGYGEYVMEKEWITITPDSAEIPAGGKQKFTIKASLPKDASVGYYSAQIAFTDEVIPSPYPQPFPNYIHAYSLSIDAWALPTIQIMTPYISDQLEAGKERDYEIILKNTADKDIGISPRLGSDMSYGGPFGVMAPPLTEDDITITAPKSIPAGAKETVKIHVKAPADAKGYYNGYIDLAIDDPSVRDYEGRVQLNFNLWKQPTEAFVKSFNLKEAAPITIEINSNLFGMYPYPYGPGSKTAKDPSFDTSLEGPAGQAQLKVTKTVIKGSVSMGGEIAPWEIDSVSIYQDIGAQYIETYTASGQPGEWKLKVMPKNTNGFEYTITIGG